MAVGKLLGIGIKSALEEAPEVLPKAMKTQSVPNALQKAGVKPEELKFSGVTDQLTGEKTSNVALTEAVTRRKDTFGVEEGGKEYQSIRPDSLAPNPTYREDVYTFSQGGEGSRFTSPHYPDIQNYLGHARRQDDMINGTRTRVVMEVQSDLHNLGTKGYDDAAAKLDISGDDMYFLEHTVRNPDSFQGAPGLLYEKVTGKAFKDLPAEQQEAVVKGFESAQGMVARNGDPDQVRKQLIDTYTAVQRPPDSPYQKTWFNKLLERQLDSAAQDGLTKVAVPIKGSSTNGLIRSEGIQGMYETKGVKTMQKIAKQNGWRFYEEQVANPNSEHLLKAAKHLENGEYRHARSALVEIDAPVSSPAGEAAAFLRSSSDVDIESNPGLKKLLVNTLNDAGQDSLTYGVIDMADEATGALKPSTKGGFSLYSSPAAGGFAAYAMLRNGASEEEVKSQLIEDGYEEGDVEEYMSTAEKIGIAAAEGYSEEQIRGYLEAQDIEVIPDGTENITPMPEDNYYNVDKLPNLSEQLENEAEKAASIGRREQTLYARQLLLGDDTLPTNELFASLRVIHPDSTFLTTTVSGFFGNEEAARVADENASAAMNKVLAAAKEEFGIDATYDPVNQVYVDNNTGQEYTLGMWDDIWQDMKGSRAELGFGLLAGVQFARAGAARYGFMGGVAGGAVGALFGSVMGTNVDYMRESSRLAQEMSAEVAARKSLNAAELSLIGDAAGAVLIKVAKGSFGTFKRVLGYARGGDIPSATKALQAHMAVTEDEATEIATQLARLSEIPGKTQAEKNIAAVAMTQPGGERIIKAATVTRPRAGQALIRDVNKRAQGLLKQTEALQDPNAARKVIEDLNNYRIDVKKVFSDVKNEAAQSTRVNNYRFDFDKLAVEPVLDSLKKEIVDPTARQRFLNQMKKIKQYAKTNNFADLLELRQVVNGLTYSRSVKNAKDFSALQGVIKNIDDEIAKGSELALDNPKEWRQAYSAANKLYSEMKVLENNQLYKVLNRKGMSAEGIAKALTRYAPSLDDTYHNVVSKLPKLTREAVEGEVFKTMVTKYTAGAEGGLRAVQFPMLANELREVPFTTPGSRKLRDAVVRLGEVFKNDVPIAQAGGQLQMPKFQSYLTTDPVVRAKFELASGVFNRVKQMVPGEQQQDLALVNALTKLLDQPLNAKLLDDLVEEAGDRVDIGADLKNLANNAAKAAADAADQGAPRVKLYGDPNSKVLNLKGGVDANTVSLPVHRIAGSDDVAQIARAEGINVADTKSIDEELRSRGYMAVQLGTEKIRRIDL